MGLRPIELVLQPTKDPSVGRPTSLMRQYQWQLVACQEMLYQGCQPHLDQGSQHNRCIQRTGHRKQVEAYHTSAGWSLDG